MVAVSTRGIQFRPSLLRSRKNSCEVHSGKQKGGIPQNLESGADLPGAFEFNLPPPVSFAWIALPTRRAVDRETLPIERAKRVDPAAVPDAEQVVPAPKAPDAAPNMRRRITKTVGVTLRNYPSSQCSPASIFAQSPPRCVRSLVCLSHFRPPVSCRLHQRLNFEVTRRRESFLLQSFTDSFLLLLDSPESLDQFVVIGPLVFSEVQDRLQQPGLRGREILLPLFVAGKVFRFDAKQARPFPGR